MSGHAVWLLGLAVVGCQGEEPFSVRITRQQGQRLAALKHDAPFRILRATPPSGSRYLGTVRFATDVFHIEQTLHEVREHARHLGGNLLAQVRCDDIDAFAALAVKHYKPTIRRGKRPQIRCVGHVFFYRP